MEQQAQLLEHQLNLLNHLSEIIKNESAALSEQDTDALLTLAEKKSECLTLLQSNDAQLSLPENAQLIKQSEELFSQAQKAKALLVDCKKNNQKNATLIEHNLASINRLSHALQASRNAFSMTYDDKGQTSTISTLGNNVEA
ncbi:flagellar protein FlgN [Shewanella sp. 202IG2-18]|uniref:flagella synthesis protein FlgN n=1 Tax=Parashewanella hymeniacidonis TaxID=2807618 RepID=UPI0019610D7B|nr:flagellar protein FlgN [Parashewanella hymeniacidonis]MBM7073063.1 flagellar protein FlgN [Parashewanella hymeniacidonis]